MYKALVAELSFSAVPTSIMGFTILCVGAYAFMAMESHALFAATVLGTGAALGKVALILHHRRRLAEVTQSLPRSRRFEAMHGAFTFGMAAGIGGQTAALFADPEVSLHLIATGLLFGYCAGVVSRVSVRPWIAGTAVAIAAIPGILAAGFFGDGAHLVVGAIFFVFLLGSMETIAHVARGARRNIAMRLQMAALARRDPLTQLLNRLGLREAFDELPRKRGEIIAVHMFDLDGFKAVNDRLGHDAGDKLLKLVAERLRSLSPGASIIARTGGDEFLIVQAGLRSGAEARAMAFAIHRTLVEPYLLGKDTGTIGVSVGYNTAAAAAANLDQQKRAADAASYKAKRAGGGVWPRTASQPSPSLLMMQGAKWEADTEG
ncbi:MAG: hypothetical protein DI629_00965 [Mesorhizobium amorphae]|nr:MAG: hypothetical protein DI629_00965 [Mesorhizobium amorphae]